MIEKQTNSDMAGIGLYEIIGYLFAHKSDDLGQPTPKEVEIGNKRIYIYYYFFI
jgi:hypothetical protein